MATKPETTFHTAVHKHLPPVSEFYREKMSNPYRGGTADYWYSGANADLWVEWKFIVLPKRGDTVIDLCGGKNPSISHLQQHWIRGRRAEGRNVWVIVGCKEGGVILTAESWEAPLTVSDFRSRLQDRKTIARRIQEHCL